MSWLLNIIITINQLFKFYFAFIHVLEVIYINAI